jgi:type II secretory pathway pseudopilin PulG
MRADRPDAGFSLAALIFFLTAASIFIAAAIPAYQMQAKRETEEELIFRGEEYSRAIQKYQRRFGVYPASVDQLVSTNGLRFLRRAYQDPITGKEFRVITVNPDGSLTGSKVFTQNIKTQSLFGNTQAPGNTTGTGNTNPTGNFGAAATPGPGTIPNAAGNPFLNQSANPAGNSITNNAGSPGTTGNQPFANGGIIGVASDSDKESIKVYNNHQKYDEWEFIAILGQSGQPNANGVSNPNEANPLANPLGNSPSGTNPNPFNSNPTGTNPRGFNPSSQTPSSGSPFGAPAGSPLGTRPGGIPQNQNPFGFGGTQQQQQQQPVQPRR